jgi:hypothetical protein
MSLEDTLQRAGVNTNRARLIVAAEQALRASRWDPEAALGKLITEVNSDARLLRGLHEITEADSRALASALLSQLAADAKGPKREGVSQNLYESHTAVDRPHPAPSTSSRASQLNRDVQATRDRPAADPSSGGVRHLRNASHADLDRPSRSISTSAAKAVLRSSVFDKRIVETFDHRWGDITQHDYLNLRIKNAFSKEVERGLEKINWPDMNTPLREFCTEKQVQDIAERADRARQQALTAVKAVAHA